MRVLHFIELDNESFDSFDSLAVRVFRVSEPLIAPTESSNAPVDLFFGGWSFALDELFGPGPGVCPDNPRQYEKCEQYMVDILSV